MALDLKINQKTPLICPYTVGVFLQSMRGGTRENRPVSEMEGWNRNFAALH
jgi:hypothetical protein